MNHIGNRNNMRMNLSTDNSINSGQDKPQNNKRSTKAGGRINITDSSVQDIKTNYFPTAASNDVGLRYAVFPPEKPEVLPLYAIDIPDNENEAVVKYAVFPPMEPALTPKYAAEPPADSNDVQLGGGIPESNPDNNQIINEIKQIYELLSSVLSKIKGQV